MKIFAGSSNKPLAQKIAKELKIPLSPLEIHIFPDGERRIRVLEKVVDEDCIVVQSCAWPVDTNYMELFFIADALKRSGAKSITGVIPYLGYQRQDHVFRSGEAVSLEVIVETLEAVGINKVIVFDLHSVRIEQAFHIPLLHLSALPIFAGEIRRIMESGRLPHIANDAWRASSLSSTFAPSSLSERRPLKSKLNSNPKTGSAFSSFASGQASTNTVLISPDMGGIRRIKLLSQMLNSLPYAAIVKNRNLETGEVEAGEIEGELKETAIIVDDMISSGGTIATACELLKKKGVKEIFVFATHAVFSDKAKDVLQNSAAAKICVTDTIYVPEEKRFKKLEILSVAEMVGKQLATSH